MNNNEKLLIRCPVCGLENYHSMVIKNICAWCGYNDNIDFQFNKDKLKLYQTLQVFRSKNKLLWFNHNYKDLTLNKLDDDYLSINAETFNLENDDIIEICEYDIEKNKLILFSSITYSNDIFEINYINGVNAKSKNQLSFNKYDAFVYQRIIKHFKN